MGKSFEEVMERFRSITFNEEFDCIVAMATIQSNSSLKVMERNRSITSSNEEFDCIVAIANGGIIPAAIINQRLQKEVYLLKINLRDDQQKPKYDRPRLVAPIDFDYKGKNILLVDDRIKTGSTVKFALELLKEANLVRTFAVNGTADYALYDETCFRFPWIV